MKQSVPQAPPTQTWFVPQPVPSVNAVPVSVQARVPLAQDRRPWSHGLAGMQAPPPTQLGPPELVVPPPELAVPAEPVEPPVATLPDVVVEAEDADVLAEPVVAPATPVVAVVPAVVPELMPDVAPPVDPRLPPVVLLATDPEVDEAAAGVPGEPVDAALALVPPVVFDDDPQPNSPTKMSTATRRDAIVKPPMANSAAAENPSFGSSEMSRSPKTERPRSQPGHGVHPKGAMEDGYLASTGSTFISVVFTLTVALWPMPFVNFTA